MLKASAQLRVESPRAWDRTVNPAASMTNRSMKAAIDSVANLFDYDMKQFIIEHLKYRHGIDLDGEKQVDRADLEGALRQLFGEAAWMILSPPSEDAQK